MSAASLILEVHGMALRLLSKHWDTHFEGLGAAARHGRRLGVLSTSMARKLIHMDAAAAMVRHITCVSTANFIKELEFIVSSKIAVPQVTPQARSSP